MIISGGVGISENLNIGGQLNIIQGIVSSSLTISSTIPDYILTSFNTPDNRLFLNTTGDMSFNLLGSGSSSTLSIYESGSLSSDTNYSKINIQFNSGQYSINNTCLLYTSDAADDSWFV